MKIYTPTITLFHDTRKVLSDDKYPLKLTVYCRTEKKRYGLKIQLTKDEWVKIKSAKLKDNRLKEIKIKITSIINRAESILKNLIPFSFTEFERHFFEKKQVKIDLSLEHWFNEYITLLESQEREGTKDSYKSALNSLSSFKANLKITDITTEFLEAYQLHMERNGKSSSTIGIYLRQLRAIINRAIKGGIIKQEDYPFKGFEIPVSRNIKKALCDQDIRLLLKYKPRSNVQTKALDFWIFIYLSNGINPIDVLHLKPENLSDTFFQFSRQKTIRMRKKDIRPIKVFISERSRQIINKWKSSDPTNPYLFPILEANLSAKTIKHRTKKFLKMVNSGMEEIRKELSIMNKIGTYAARHSFSTRLMRNGVSTQFIKNSLGHSSVAVTENYLGDFEDQTKIEYSGYLTNF